MKYNLFILTSLMLCLCFNSCKTSQKAASSEQPPLLGTHWNITVIEGQTVSKDLEEQPFIVFDTNGRYYGNLGCNAFFGEYYAKKNKMKLSYAGATKKLCQDMETERAMTKALKNDIDSYALQQNGLILYSNKKEILRLEKGTK